MRERGQGVQGQGPVQPNPPQGPRLDGVVPEEGAGAKARCSRKAGGCRGEGQARKEGTGAKDSRACRG